MGRIGSSTCCHASINRCRPDGGTDKAGCIVRHAKWEASMKMFKSVARAVAGATVAGMVAIGGTSAASAQATAKYTAIQNQFGATITLDTSSCTGGSISAPFSINSSTSSATFSGTTSGSSTLCNVRYQSGTFGC